MKEYATWKPKWTFEKYDNKEAYENDKPFEVKVVEGNLLLNVGINEIWDLVTGKSANHFDHQNTKFGVGNSTTDSVATQTDLLGTEKDYISLDAGYPQSGEEQKVVFRGIADAESANFDWREFVLKNTSGKVLNRLVSKQGTKEQGQMWVVTLEVLLV